MENQTNKETILLVKNGDGLKSHANHRPSTHFLCPLTHSMKSHELLLYWFIINYVCLIQVEMIKKIYATKHKDNATDYHFFILNSSMKKKVNTE